MKRHRSSTARRLLPLSLFAMLSGCGGQAPTIDDAVFVPDPALPAPKAVSPASPPPAKDASKAAGPPKAAPTAP